MAVAPSTVVGIAETSFKGQENQVITGKTIHLTTPMDPQKGVGVTTEHIFLSSAKEDAMDFKLALNQEVEIFYNRFGKIASLRLISDAGAIDF
jgi:hypothetical protein